MGSGKRVTKFCHRYTLQADHPALALSLSLKRPVIVTTDLVRVAEGCNLYNLTTSKEAIRQWTSALRDILGNLEPLRKVLRSGS
ncbi:MAG: hypothetical protein E5Y74_05570 [Mesorhizobium sp.]|nr:MAG: hypothetical protein E5Y74_05570 [Mesorhizobium sp.]